jgi:hypothetical protein
MDCQDYIYGKHAIYFLGDFCQFEAIGGDCIYKNQNNIYWEQALTGMVELKGTHLFNDCTDMLKRIMPNMQDGVLSAEERKILNSHVINGNKVKNQICKKQNMLHSSMQREPISMQRYSEII